MRYAEDGLTVPLVISSALVIALYAIVRCSGPSYMDQVDEVLITNGCSDIRYGTTPVTACADELEAISFTCTRSGKEASGYVCGDAVSGYHVRYNKGD